MQVVPHTKPVLSLRRTMIRDLDDRDGLLASQGHSLWTCDRPIDFDPLSPIVREIDKIRHEVEGEVGGGDPVPPSFEIDRENLQGGFEG